MIEMFGVGAFLGVVFGVLTTVVSVGTSEAEYSRTAAKSGWVLLGVVLLFTAALSLLAAVTIHDSRCGDGRAYVALGPRHDYTCVEIADLANAPLSTPDEEN